MVGATCLLMHTSSAMACPMCKMALETDDPQPRAYMTSILFMLGAITTVFAAVAGLLVYVSRREQQALLDAGYEHVFHNAVTAPQPESQG
uniref:Uncharacterized protein n=1 Tax=Schlesneria paludicola TaxID=360056 RepID=A0A7C2JZF1_9PLAN